MKRLLYLYSWNKTTRVSLEVSVIIRHNVFWMGLSNDIHNTFTSKNGEQTKSSKTALTDTKPNLDSVGNFKTELKDITQKNKLTRLTTLIKDEVEKIQNITNINRTSVERLNKFLHFNVVYGRKRTRKRF